MSAKKELDPITFEILRHRVSAINDEAASSLRLISGSPVVTEVNDYNTAILKPDGDIVVIGAYISAHAISVMEAVRYVMREYQDNPGIKRDDMFITNDIYVGALHQGDVQCIAPIYFGDELVAWTGVSTHHVDVGGPVAGSAAVGAKSVFEEAPLIPPIKIVENGVIRRDIEREFLRRSRLPKLSALDLRGEIGANNTAKKRIEELIEVYGLETFKLLLDQTIDYTEKRFRLRLSELPDGTWRHVTYIDYEEDIYPCALTLTKSGEAMSLDFSGTAKQAPALINCTYPVLRAFTTSTLLSYLCFDIPWCPTAIMRTVDVVSEPGTVLSATWPAGGSKATTTAYFAVMNLVSNCAAKMMAASDKHRSHLMATWEGSLPLNEIFGIDQRGEPFGTMVLDAAMAGGGGARSYKDGVDTAGFLGAPYIAISNVETQEFKYPMLYLYRRQQEDSGGPGRFRGGTALSLMYIPHDVEAIQSLILHAFGVEFPASVGVFGGYPGSTCYYTIKRESNIHELFAMGKIPDELEGVSGELEIEPAMVLTDLKKGDVYRCQGVGGGGYGDPIERDSALVQKDVIAGLVSVKGAAETYGVIVEPKALRVDKEKTLKRRESIREQRKESRTVDGRLSSGQDLRSKMEKVGCVSEYLDIVETKGIKHIQCRCGHALGPAKENYKEYAHRSDRPLADAGSLVNPYNIGTERFVFRLFFCPKCFTLLETEIAFKESPVLRDYQLPG